MRLRLSGLAIVVALLGAPIGPLVAAALPHGACTPTHHDCGKALRISRCCCDEPPAADAATPAAAKVDVMPVHTTAFPFLRLAPSATCAPARAAGTDPRWCPRDLTTLYSTLLI